MKDLIKFPIKKSTKSDQYSLIIVDAKDVIHFWLLNGNYDGYDKECKS